MRKVPIHKLIIFKTNRPNNIRILSIFKMANYQESYGPHHGSTNPNQKILEMVEQGNLKVCSIYSIHF